MGERGARRGAGAPFYVPLRRKTSAEIISEARAAIYGEMTSAANGSTVGGGVVGPGGALRPLRTRRPYTPREPQRSLFTERIRNKDNRPTSGFDVKFASLSESAEESLSTFDSRLANLDEDALDDMLESHNVKKKPQGRMVPRTSHPPNADRTVDSWSGFPKLPHLSGRSKPLHRRNTIGQVHNDNVKPDPALAEAICVIRPLGDDNSNDNNNAAVLNVETKTKRSQFVGCKTVSCDVSYCETFNDIAVKHIALQLPNTTNEQYENMNLLELSEALSQGNRNPHRIVQLMESVIRMVEVNPPSGSLRDMLVRALFSHADHTNDEVLVAVARALLTMRVTGSHLSATCKLVFKIAKNDKNDHFFRDTNLLELVVEGCGRAEPISESSCCVFGCAALRVLALDPPLAARATSAGAVHLAALHLKILNNYKSENPRSLNEECTHALYQVTGALRSLASVVDTHATEFIASGALPELVAALALHTDRDVLTNVARCLSVISGSAECCAALCSCAGAPRGVLRALAACGARAPLAVRLAYTLGNMAADDELTRIDIYNEDGSIDVLLTILESYISRIVQGTRESESDPDIHLIGTDLGGSDGSDEDVLIKTVRVVANLCLSERAGRGVATIHAERTVKCLHACLELAEKIVQREKLSTYESAGSAYMERGEELSTAALATLNNVTFYNEPPDPPDPLHEHFDNICKLTCRWLHQFGADSTSSCEAVRALGNMSRSVRTAQLIVIEGALDMLEPFLMHENVSVRCAASGVLVNVCGAGVSSSGAGEVAARALERCAACGDCPPAPLLARALWNAHAHSPRVLEPAHAQRVAAALSLFIDDESVFTACQGSNIEEQNTNEPNLSKHHVTFELDGYVSKSGVMGTEWEGSDLGFEEGEAEECTCEPCRRLSYWDQLVAVAIPLIEKMRPSKCDAAVGTD